MAQLNDFSKITHKGNEIGKVLHQGKTIWHREPDVYLAQDSDFVKVDTNWVYRGTELEVEIPTHINGELVTSTQNMFNGFLTYQATPVTKVVLKHSNVTNMDAMFNYSNATTLDLSDFNTSNVTSMARMFNQPSIKTLDLSGFDTSNVTSMNSMFTSCKAPTLDLSNFNTSNVTDMLFMFRFTEARTLDLSSFDTSNVTKTILMFGNAKATTGYARTQADANKFNSSSDKPAGLTFVVKPSDVPEPSPIYSQEFNVNVKGGQTFSISGYENQKIFIRFTLEHDTNVSYPVYEAPMYTVLLYSNSEQIAHYGDNLYSGNHRIDVVEFLNISGFNRFDIGGEALFFLNPPYFKGRIDIYRAS